MTGFAELVAATNYSFMRGASHPSDMVAEAHALGLAAIGIADRNSVAGVVRAFAALRDAPEKARAARLAEKEARGEPLVLDADEEAACRIDLRLVVGARLVFADGTPDIVAYPTTRHGWGRLTRLLSRGNLRAVKGDCILTAADLADHLDDLLLIVLPQASAEAQQSHRTPVDYPDGEAPHPPLQGEGRRPGPGPGRRGGVAPRPADAAEPCSATGLTPPRTFGPTLPLQGRVGASAGVRFECDGPPACGEEPPPAPPPHRGSLRDSSSSRNRGEGERAMSRPVNLVVLQGGKPGPSETRASGASHSTRPHAEVAGAAGPRSTHDRGASFEARLRRAPQDEEGGNLPNTLARLARAAPGRVWLGAAMAYRGDDARRLAKLAAIAAAAGVPLLATGDVLYATPAQRPLHDVLTCIRLRTTIAEAGRVLEAHAERHLKPEAEMRRLFRRYPEAVDETLRFVDRIAFTLDELRYEYPHEPVPPGWKPLAYLLHLVKEAARARYGAMLTRKVRKLLAEEFWLIRRRGYAYYFLTVYDLVRFARDQEPPILCQGRGSAANSIVCFLLGVTSVDPCEHDLLFSRFISEDRHEPPDIDVDFEHERREEVMQYIYRRYGRHRAGIAATVIHYRPRSAVGEVGKVLGFTEDMTARLASTVWGSFAGTMERRRYVEGGVDPANPGIARLRALVDQLLEFPRHLSQHVGGFVLTQDRLDETVPIHHGAMAGRSFIEWDKDDIDALGLMKVDVLALGMLTCIGKSFALMKEHGLGEQSLDVDLKSDDAAVYAMLQKGDSIGVFQVESRAQINMLPRLKPRSLHDLTVQVAIVRPGPIEGEMVHPYLRRRSGLEKVTYPSPAPPNDPDELRKLLGRTFGVPLFQEQAMKLAIVAARFTPPEANQLRRAMATFRNVGTIQSFRGKMVEGMVARGYDRAFAERCFKQIEGFGSYGFPESHALSFARLVYVSSWIKCHHPAVFCCALLNSQPMGFYAPAQLVRDAIEHDVVVRPIDVNASGWDCSLERQENGTLALRLGLRQLDGFREAWAATLAGERAAGPFRDVETLARRTALPPRALRILADGDAFGSIALDRRDALWEVRRTPSDTLPLFAAAEARELGTEPAMDLPAMPPAEHVALDYQTTRLSLKGHPMAFLRERARAERVLSCAEIAAARPGARVRGAGITLVRQRPGKGNAIFVTLEDETGILNVIIWARLFETMRRPVMTARLMLVEGEVQKSPENVAHLIASRVHDRSAWLNGLAETTASPDPLRRIAAARDTDRRAGHPRDLRVLPKSRDFH